MVRKIIAKYLNWYAKCQACQGAGGAGIHLTPQGIDFRGRTLSAIYTRLVQTDRHHPALLVYSHDCQLLQQDSICTPPYSRYISIRKIKNSPFIHVYTIFFRKISKNPNKNYKTGHANKMQIQKQQNQQQK